ncbi:unnamed protein product [Cercospora beticola]|nr:unnamed protein product [Cercospora beticola]
MEEEDTLFVPRDNSSQAAGERSEASIRASSPALSLSGSISSSIFFQGNARDLEELDMVDIASVASLPNEMADAGVNEARAHDLHKRPNSKPGGGPDDDRADSVLDDDDSRDSDDGFPDPADVEPYNDPESEDYVLQPGDPGFVGPIYAHSPEWHTHPVQGYTRHIYYEIGFDRNKVPAANATREVLLHDGRCRPMIEFFDRCTVAETIDVHFPDHSPLRVWNEFWAAESALWDKATLIHIHFHGRSWGRNEDYTWKVPGLARPLKVYAFMQELNETDSDIVYLLDTWINTRFKRFHRTHAMTEFILAGMSEPVRGTGEQRATFEGDFSLAFPRILGDYLEDRRYDHAHFQRAIMDYIRDPRTVQQLEGFEELQSTPELMRWDKSLSNNCLRIWDLKPSKASAKRGIEIWRIKVDPYICQVTGLMHFCRKRIQPEPEPPEEGTPEPADEEMEDVPDWAPEEEDHDEGFVSDEEEEQGSCDGDGGGDGGDDDNDGGGAGSGSASGSSPADLVNMNMHGGEDDDDMPHDNF